MEVNSAIDGLINKFNMEKKEPLNMKVGQQKDCKEKRKGKGAKSKTRSPRDLG